MKKLTSFEDHLKKERGKPRSKKRQEFDAASLAFRMGAMLKDARKETKMTQEQLAKKIGTKKSDGIGF